MGGAADFETCALLQYRLSNSFKMKFIGVFITLLAVAYGNVCENPTVDSVAYTTTDGTLVSKIAFLSDFTVSCSNGAKDLSLYADTGANIISVARAGALNYQVSWTEEISAVASGERSVKLYDEQGYSALKKAQRSGESVESIAPLATLNIYHAGTYTGPYVQSDKVAILSAIGVFYYAYSVKSYITE